ncbi:hypothetical protein BH10PSE18_BH10PSE18_08350 [soil metagenome]
MAAITAIDARQQGAFAAVPTVLSADDTITVDASRKQLLVLRNPTAGALTATVDGADATTARVPGYGTVSVSAGYAIAVPAGAVRAVQLSTIALYLKGVVHITGGPLLEATLYNL